MNGVPARALVAAGLLVPTALVSALVAQREFASATTMAYAPSGVKYMLYGSITGILAPARLPVTGSIGVTVLASLLSTQSFVRSYAGTTCCGTAPVLKVRTTR